MFDRKIFFDAVRSDPFGGSITQDQVEGMNFILDTWEKGRKRPHPMICDGSPMLSPRPLKPRSDRWSGVLYRWGPIKANACSAQNTWLCRLAIHWRPAAVTFR